MTRRRPTWRASFGGRCLVLSREHGAWHVKSMGDGAMIWVPDAGSAVRLAERMLTEVGTRPDLLPVRVGAHTGPAVMRDGDWYGSAVNVAARLADVADPNEAVVSDATQSIADDEGARRPVLPRRGGPARRCRARSSCGAWHRAPAAASSAASAHGGGGGTTSPRPAPALGVASRSPA